jgi:predicted alpha-1,2-mannosidase
VILALLALGAALPGVAAAASPLSRVDVFAGTQPGPDTFGGGHNYPGAAAPFGMVQWSPDTTPAAPHSGGYDYRDHHVSGFSLTHLSGAGCAVYGDFPFLPTTEPLNASPAPKAWPGLAGRFQPGFSHASESGEPGFYSARLQPHGGGPIGVELTASTRTGFAEFHFPKSPHASVLVNAGGSAQPDDSAEVHLDPARREISGSASSGLFCGQRPRYRVYFAAVFDRPFAASGAWQREDLMPGATGAADAVEPAANPPVTARAGAYATFDTGVRREVGVRVGISFVSVAGARRNLAAESTGRGFAAVRAATQARWRAALGRIQASGGSPEQLDTFYTALYHALLAPRTFSDVGGTYIGMDGRIHRAVDRVQYADFSGWDVYRTEIPLLALLVPERAGQMVQSLLADDAQSGCLPRWPYANGQSMTMVGDSADPIIAGAAAFGAGGFNRAAALAAMVSGADEGCTSANGEYVERQGLASYLSHGWVAFDEDTGTRNANSIYGSPDSVWGSAATSLEYSIDDFAISQFAARHAGAPADYRAFIHRGANWRNLFEPAAGMIEPRFASGAFPEPYDNLHGGGFVEGDSAQYTWMVPQDPAGLIHRLGGPAPAARRLDYFLRELNGGAGGTHTDHALLGDEPTLGAPWLYDWMRRPWATQAAVRRQLRLYSTAPDGYPGNDDLGTLSAAYIFGALGMYPAQPGTGNLALATPIFKRAEVKLAHGRRALITASGHGAYTAGLKLNGHAYTRPWTTYCALAGGATVAYELAAKPVKGWGAAAAATPPSYGPNRPIPRNACAP